MISSIMPIVALASILATIFSLWRIIVPTKELSRGTALFAAIFYTAIWGGWITYRHFSGAIVQEAADRAVAQEATLTKDRERAAFSHRLSFFGFQGTMTCEEALKAIFDYERADRQRLVEFHWRTFDPTRDGRPLDSFPGHGFSHSSEFLTGKAAKPFQAPSRPAGKLLSCAGRAKLEHRQRYADVDFKKEFFDGEEVLSEVTMSARGNVDLVAVQQTLAERHGNPDRKSRSDDGGTTYVGWNCWSPSGSEKRRAYPDSMVDCDLMATLSESSIVLNYKNPLVPEMLKRRHKADQAAHDAYTRERFKATQPDVGKKL